MVGAKRQDNQLHEEEEPDSVKEAADEEVVAQEMQFFAGKAIHRSGGEGDEVVNAEAEDVLAGRHMTSGCTDQAAGNSYRHVASEGHVGGGHVEQAGNGAAHSNRECQVGCLSFYRNGNGGHGDLTAGGIRTKGLAG